MELTINGKYEITNIKFCCGSIAEDLILTGELSATPWTDHKPRFRLGKKYFIDHCPHCGAKIIAGGL